MSWPSLASLNPQAWRSMCGWIRKWHLGGFPEALDKPVEADRADWPAALGNEYVGVCQVIAAFIAQSNRATLHDRLRDQPARRAHPTPGKAVCRIYGTQLASTIRYGPAGPTARNRRSYFSCGVRGNGSVAGALPDPVRDGGTP